MFKPNMFQTHSCLRSKILFQISVLCLFSRQACGQRQLQTSPCLSLPLSAYGVAYCLEDPVGLPKASVSGWPLCFSKNCQGQARFPSSIVDSPVWASSALPLATQCPLKSSMDHQWNDGLCVVHRKDQSIISKAGHPRGQGHQTEL
jgi:hypothetical protein